LHNQRGGGVDVEVCPEGAFGDTPVQDVLDQLVQRQQHAGIFTGQRFGQVIVVEGQTPVDAVLGGGFSRRADPVDEQAQRRRACQPGRLFAPLLRRLGHDLVDQREQQLILGGKVLVEGSQRRL